MAVPALPDTVQDPVTDDFITTAWGDQVNTTIDYALRDRPHCRVYNSANISVNNTTITALTFDSERYDVGAMHSTSSNTGRITITDAGLYSFEACISFASNATGVRTVSIRLNGVTTIEQQQLTALNGGTTDMSVSTHYQMVAGDYVDLAVYQSSGGALNVAATANYSPEFSALWEAS